MNPRVVNVKPNTDYTIDLEFDNGEQKIFDVKPYINKGIFKELKKKKIFNTVKVVYGTVEWINGQDFCPDVLHAFSKKGGQVST